MMKKRKVISLVAAVTVVAALGIGATLAYFTDQAEQTNVVTMGHVDIDLEEPRFSEENEDNTITHVVPKQEITKDPTIVVAADSESAYLRVKLIFEGLTEDQIAELLPGIGMDADDWVLSADGYYYYQNRITKTGEEQRVPVFTTVHIPETWGNEVADTSFTISIKAEAIQADHFTPTTNDADQITGWNYSDGTAVTAENYTAPVTP